MRFIDKTNKDLTLYELELTAKIHDIEMYATEDNTETGVKVDYVDIKALYSLYSIYFNGIPVLEYAKFSKVMEYIFNNFDYQTNWYIFNYDGSKN